MEKNHEEIGGHLSFDLWITFKLKNFNVISVGPTQIGRKDVLHYLVMIIIRLSSFYVKNSRCWTINFSCDL